MTGNCTMLFVLNDKEEAAYFQNDLQHFIEKKDVLFLNDSFKKPGSFDELNNSNVQLRTEVINRITNSVTKNELIVTYPEALMEKVVNTQALLKSTLFIKMNEKLDQDFLLEMLITYGFERVDFVYEPGQFSIRGDILDKWGREFGFTQTELGQITGMGLMGFGLTIIFFSFFADVVGFTPYCDAHPAEQVVASIDAGGRGPGTYTLDVVVRAPSGVSVQTVQPARVTLTIRAK